MSEFNNYKMINQLLNNINRFFIGRTFLKILIFIRYWQKGMDIKSVKFLSDLNIWEITISNEIYLCTGPGWAYNYEYLFNQLKELAGHEYLPKNGDVVFDIGAGVGEETIVLSKLVGENGRVYSFEAHPKTFKALEYLVERNNLKNVIPCNLALSDSVGTVEIEDSDNSLANSILPLDKKIGAFHVNSTTLDVFIQQQGLTKIDFVKMNVEGAEQLIIKGMDQVMPIIKNLAISCHDFRYNNGESEFFKTKEIVTRFLGKHNFVVKTQNTKINMVDDYVYAINPKYASKSSMPNAQG
jgi:FkbM family methyltransferase